MTIIKSKSLYYPTYLVFFIIIFSAMTILFYIQYVSKYVIFPSPVVSLQHFYNDYIESYLNDGDEQFVQEKNDRIFKKLQTVYKNDSLHEFKVIHEKIMNGRLPMKISVNGHTNAGYANRLYSMLSSLVIALVTDSAFIVRWTRISNHIREPFFKTFHNFASEQNEFNIDYNPVNLLHPKDVAGWQLTRNMNKLIKTSLPTNRTRFLYKDIEGYFYELCTNPEYYDKFYYYDLVSRDTILKAHEVAYNIIHNISNYTEEYKQDIILQVSFEVGGNLLNKMWIPKDHIMDKVNHYVNNVFKNYYMIGIQLRYQYIKDPLDTYKFLNCSFDVEENITKSMPDFNSKYKAVKWFLTSDSAGVIERLKKEYPNKIIVSEGQVGHIESNADSYPRTILDVELLSRCNELVLTGGSTFGNILFILSLAFIGFMN